MDLFKESLNIFCNEQSLNGVIVFGAGTIGKIVTFIFQLENIPIIACFDNNLNNTEKYIWESISCDSPYLIGTDVPVFISVENFNAKKEIRKQCKLLGYKNIYDINISKIYQYLDKMPDEAFLKLQYYLRTNGKILNLENPILFNEKLQWLKLYDRNPIYHKLVDKYEVKEIVARIIGKEHIIKTIGIWNQFDEIDFQILPQQFVLKCTHDSGSIIICKNKSEFNVEEARKKLEFCRQRDYYRLCREWVYKDLTPKIIAEVYMKNDEESDLKDYKVFCFSGNPRIIQVDGERFTEHYRNLYTTDWQYIDGYIEYPSNPNKIDAKPKKLNEMLKLATKLSQGMPFVRVDFYIVNDKIYFGELTFSHGAGYEEIFPKEFEIKLGNWIKVNL